MRAALQTVTDESYHRRDASSLRDATGCFAAVYPTISLAVRIAQGPDG